ncbi:translation initiation factor IF-2-like [Serinus canaria]|uniref:translation initiation factor IF-2-like n=1 Tax=Serinus canaria TaxID=9135 RepID=UPI0021CC7058|nr:translation initiation factor IF-2-like [Serinus canaria]
MLYNFSIDYTLSQQFSLSVTKDRSMTKSVLHDAYQLHHLETKGIQSGYASGLLQTLGVPSRANPRLPESPCTRKGEGGTIKKLDTGRQACRSGESPGLGSFPSPDHRGSSREPQRHQPPQTCPTTQPPGKREGGRARQERQNPAFDQPPSPARSRRGAQRAPRRPAPASPRPPTERRGPGYLVCPGAASADAPCLPPPGSSRLASLQLSAEAAAPSDASSAASAAEPLPAARGGGRGTTFSWRRGPAGARARPGPAGGLCPGCRPPRSPRRGSERGPLAALGGAAGGGRYPSAGVVTSGPRECPPSGRPGGGRGTGRWWHRRRGSDPARHRGAAAAAPLRGGRASGDPARCPPLPGCHGDRLPASQNGGGGGTARGRRSPRRPGRKEGRQTASLRRQWL